MLTLFCCCVFRPAGATLAAATLIGPPGGSGGTVAGGAEALAGELLAGLARLLIAAVVGWLVAEALHRHAVGSRLPERALACCVVLVLAGAGAALGALPVAGALGTPGVLLAVAAAARRSGALRAAARVWGEDEAAREWPWPSPAALAQLASRIVATARGCPSTRLSRPSSGLLVGRGAPRGGPVRIAAGHTLVVGATGAGKTVTVRRILHEASLRMGVVAVDGKGDADLERDLERLAAARGRRFLAWSPQLSTRYSPFSHGADSEIVDKALAAESWGDEYYLRLGQRFLGFAVRALRAAGRRPTLAELATFVDPDSLELLAPAIEAASPGAWRQIRSTLPPLRAAERQAIAGTQHRLAALAESDVGALLEPAAGEAAIDLLDAVRDGDVVYFDLNADARPELSRMLGAAIVMDLLGVAATLQATGDRAPTVVLLDDVQAFATARTMDGLASLSARGRSAGLMLLVATQSLADLEAGGARNVTDQLLDNRSALIVHRLPGQASAARASRELGERPVSRLAEHVAASAGGWRSRRSGTRSVEQAPWLAPSVLAALPTGVAAVARVGEPPRLTRVLSP